MYRFNRMKERILLIALLGAVLPAWGSQFPVAGLRLNPAFHLDVKELQPAAPGQGFLLQASNPEFEVVVKGVPIANPKTADQMARVTLGNIKNLYNPHGNPYAGQISSLIVCQKAFRPQSLHIRVGSSSREVLTGGANSRRLFGACTPDQIAYWAGYFNFYDAANSRNVDVRVYAKAQSPKPGDVKHLQKNLSAFLEHLMVDAKP